MKKFLNKKTLFISIITIVIVLILSLSIFFIWTQNTYSAIDVERLEIEEVKDAEDGWYIYTAEHADKGLILYPGAKVEPEAYAYLAQELAKQNITVAIPSVRLNLPILDVSKANEVINNGNHLDWYIAGHSMGGAAAAMYVDQHLDKVNGLILLGAYAASNDVLSESNLPVLSISGAVDGLSTPEKIKKYSSNLPETTNFIEILGGNHAYFGVYGSQSGDNEAQITVGEQQAMIIDSIVTWLNDVHVTSQGET
ncbi:alpha/beta family hydrolase [Halalkalibacter sp. APA_J-10(15)]|uniref:alpha/beta family hydrolase n=1 Tax=Halalkalibacter sp. APA_J-10(15) TaxID=2933805 RepID=UPI001FF5E051|nr:alpha/beta family hydrolase [Halalkalibacter sp. APA_J-10(15)]MCK0473687.1 alpha/beta hydrolase [Halalkalibacter sp. APA_J-10(15)]